MLDWEGLFKRYVWNPRTTPYLIPVAKLNKQQADYEILAFCLFIGVLFSVVAIGSLSEVAPHGRSPLMALYAFSVVCAAVLLQFTKMFPAGLYLAATPFAAAGYVIFFGLESEREFVDTVIVAAIILLLLWYAFRLVAIVRIYPQLPEADDEPPRRRLFK